MGRVVAGRAQADRRSERQRAPEPTLAPATSPGPPPAPARGQREAPARGQPEAPARGQREAPAPRATRAQLVAFTLFVVCALGLLYFLLPRLLGFQATWNRLQQGNGWWLAVALGFEVLSFACYIVLFHAVFRPGHPRIGWRVSGQITLAGLVATRLISAAGVGGIALTAWALSRAGMSARTLAERMVAFLALLYGVYMLALVIDGIALYLGLWAGPGPFAITIVPALFAAIVITAFLLASLLPRDFDRLVGRWSGEGGRIGRLAGRLSTVPAAAAGGVRTAITLLRGREPALLCAVGAWAFDIATLWACFRAFGASPHRGVIVMAYFIGWTANALPLPGGIGGVEGGMIGAFVAFGVPVKTAVVAVLAYRALSFWLPMLPGAVAYLQLRRSVSRWRASARAADHTRAADHKPTPSYT